MEHAVCISTITTPVPRGTRVGEVGTEGRIPPRVAGPLFQEERNSCKKRMVSPPNTSGTLQGRRPNSFKKSKDLDRPKELPPPTRERKTAREPEETVCFGPRAQLRAINFSTERLDTPPRPEIDPSSL
jgi:hypothetical protein